MRSLKTTRKIKGFDVDNGSGTNTNAGYKQGKPIVAVDFDGTLVKNRYPFCENPNMRLINFILDHKDEYIWILFTCRHNEQLAMAKKYLWDEFGLEFDYVNENVPWLIEEYGDSRKIFADYYIDDKSANIKEGKVMLID